MDILIKSFNRPYYLDRCIHSIYQNIEGVDFTIKILDDGTPEKYLQKILKKYPQIQICKSDFYDQKSFAIMQNDFAQMKLKSAIPIRLWLQEAQNATDYFLLLEDDIWLTEKINFDSTITLLKSKKIYFLKLFWLGNEKLTEEKLTEKIDFISIYRPQITTSNPLLFRIIFRINRLKSRAILSFLGIYSKEKFLKYYTIYSVAGVVFKREYFVNLWKNHNDTVDEHLQISNAVKYYHRNKKILFARTNIEVAKTGFVSSATNEHKNYEGVNLDMFAVNKILNEAWYNDEFDTLDNFPKELNQEKIASILERQNQRLAQKKEWQMWVERFKNQFRSFGCNID